VAPARNRFPRGPNYYSQSVGYLRDSYVLNSARLCHEVAQ